MLGELVAPELFVGGKGGIVARGRACSVADPVGVELAQQVGDGGRVKLILHGHKWQQLQSYIATNMLTVCLCTRGTKVAMKSTDGEINSKPFAWLEEKTV